METLRVCEVPLDERPRERLLAVGPRHLTITELLTILINTGTRSESAIMLAQRLISTFSLERLESIGVRQFMTLSGIGMTKACTLVAAIELGRRISSNTRHKSRINTIDDIGPKYRELLAREQVEYLYGIFLDIRRGVISEQCITKGTTSASLIHPREFFREALLCGASAAIAVHNHPSGNPEPSVEDVQATKVLITAGEALGIPLMDHVVVGAQGYKSVMELALPEISRPTGFEPEPSSGNIGEKPKGRYEKSRFRAESGKSGG